ncbi:MAG: rhomboid family intramembrane serine protease [Actinomycetota bacterium]|nr:rhomboid family intramembrane serine protease [Actinomycetota bacterium]
MIPLKDNIPTDRFPVVTVAFIVINIAFFIWQLTFSGEPQLSEEPLNYSNINQSSLEYGAIPYRVTHPDEAGDCAVGAVGQADTSGNYEAGVVCPGTPEYVKAEALDDSDPQSDLFIPVNQAPWYVTLFTSMFMHGGILHIAGNMLFLWVFGNNIEDSMGRLKFALFYLAAGIVALYSQALLDVNSTVPTIGASGAVAGVLGAYALLHPGARVLTLIFIIFFVTVVEIPALILLAIWFILQFLPALGQVATPEVGGGGGVAYFAHVGGFLFGLATIKLLANKRRDPEPRLPVY